MIMQDEAKILTEWYSRAENTNRRADMRYIRDLLVLAMALLVAALTLLAGLN